MNHKPILIALSSAATGLLLTQCAQPGGEGWHRPARPGERVGQVMEVKGSSLVIGIDESCLVHSGDQLTAKRIFCDPKPGKTGVKDCKAHPSGEIVVNTVNPEEHTATATLSWGSVATDSPVFMANSVISGRTVEP